jgi:hypothetical protein
MPKATKEFLVDKVTVPLTPSQRKRLEVAAARFPGQPALSKFVRIAMEKGMEVFEREASAPLPANG